VGPPKKPRKPRKQKKGLQDFVEAPPSSDVSDETYHSLPSSLEPMRKNFASTWPWLHAWMQRIHMDASLKDLRMKTLPTN
jgi:hypothetical protein